MKNKNYWKLTGRYKIKDFYDKDLLYLKIKRLSGFELNNCFFYNYNWDDYNIKIDITVFWEEECNQAIAENNCEELINQSINILNYVFSEKVFFDFYESNICKCTDIERKEFISQLHISKSTNYYKIKQYNNLISNLDNKNLRIFYSCINYYNRGLQLYKLSIYEEAFLCFFKGIELLANSYIEKEELNIKDKIEKKCKDALEYIVNSIYIEEFDSKYHEELINKFKRTVWKHIDTKRKIKLLLAQYIKNDITDKINTMVRIRNKMVAHGSIISRRDEIIKASDTSFIILEGILSLYFFGQPLKKLLIKTNKKESTKLSIEVNRRFLFKI
ncbi:hypothetical protein [Clostridium felsineum]|uniref:hypothetical protein n=1 Tax=Clostridium felsineum TaxID=36839 RepID=UPI00098BFBB3|nr:hypothetical protein [Clostridium felsineum]URZ02722.1 hypothetical protein CLAUR_027460 [Clostridium felsineum]